MEIKKEETQDLNEGDGGVGVEKRIAFHKIPELEELDNLQLFLEENLCEEQVVEMQTEYKEDALFKEQIDNHYNNSVLKIKLEQQGNEAYDFLSQIFAQEEKVMPKNQKQKLWQRINKNL